MYSGYNQCHKTSAHTGITLSLPLHLSILLFDATRSTFLLTLYITKGNRFVRLRPARLNVRTNVLAILLNGVHVENSLQ